MVDEGAGNVRLTQGRAGDIGIYMQTDDSVMICFCEAKYGRPKVLRGGDGVHHLLTLHRIRTRK
jgi:hypothetical protein